MGLIKCPICGEKFADTYKRCPFCEEDANPGKLRQPKRYNSEGRRIKRGEDEPPRAVYYEEEEDYRPRRSAPEQEEDEPRAYRLRRSRRESYDEDYDDDLAYEDDYDDYDDDDRGSPRFKIVVAILLAIILLCVLYLGRSVIGSLLPDKDPTPPSSMVSDDVPQPGDDDIVLPGNVDDQPDVLPNDGNEEEPDDDPEISVPAAALKLSHEDVTLAGGEKFSLTASGGNGSTTYSVRDETIASVSAGGVVTGLKKGVTEVTVRRGDSSAVCIVRVRSDAPGSNQSASTGSDTGSGDTGSKNATLSSEDFTLKVGESHTLKLSGVTTALTWSVADSSVATVSGSGKVTAVAPGKTTVTVSWDGQSRECIVRVKA